MGDRKDFSQTELLKYLGQFTVNRARCEKCGMIALDKKLNLHHRDGRSDNNSCKNIESTRTVRIKCKSIN